MTVSTELRERVAEVFNIGRTGISEIRDQQHVSDGRIQSDLDAITRDGMAAYVGSPVSESFARLWELTLAKAHSELHPPIGVIGKEELPETNTTDDEKPKKRTKKEQV